MLNYLKTHKLAWLVTAVYGVVFCLISLINHYNFRTYGLDLGIYTHGIYSYSHLHWHQFTLGLEGESFNHLGNHFSPIVALLSPFYYLFGTYTLLILQIAAIVFGGWGIYLFAKERLEGFQPELVMVLFFSMWGIYSALAYDWHANVMAAMFVPWFILFYERKDWKKAMMMFVLVLICKENMAVWMAAILAGLAVRDFFLKPNQTNWLFLGSLLGSAIVYFLVVQAVIMPALNTAGVSDHLGNYSHLGNGPVGVIKTMLGKPRHIFYLMFESLQNDPLTFMLKSQLHFMVLVSGGFALIYRPHYLITLAPIYAQKLLSSNPAHWGVYSQYSIEFAPIIALAFVEWMQHFPFEKWKTTLLIGTIATATFFNWHPTRPNTGFYQSAHYQSGLNSEAIYNALELIPADAVVSASNVIVPHVADREKIYLFPVVKDADYLAILTHGRDLYPVDSLEFPQKMVELRSDSLNEIIYDENDFLIIKRKVISEGMR
ncbi:MAG: DUF2079 domain-containing protein [Flavobacteriales bacterium]|nr:DUF2079 domain-containing protein [Flavobacteriales bacterium]